MKKVLVVVDMQKDFIDGAVGTAEAQAIVPKVKDKVSAVGKGTGVLFTRDTHQENYLDTQEGKFLPIAHCIEGTEGHKIDKGIYLAFCGNKQKDSIMINGTTVPPINKPTFGSTELVALLKMLIDNGVEEVEFVGLCTDICVMANAVLAKTFFPEITIKVDSSCCAGVTPQKHEAALETMRSLQIVVY